MNENHNPLNDGWVSMDAEPDRGHAAASARHQKPTDKKKRGADLIWWVCLLLCIGVFCYSAWQLIAYWQEGRASDNYVADLAQQTVTVKQPQQTDEQEAASAPETAPIQVDFAVLQAQNPDVVAWLYCPDTVVNYPVAQAGDNDKYLHTLLDGTANNNGTLFMDYRNAADLSDGLAIIYGHNMKSGKMFGTLDNYKKQDYFDAHPVWYLLTPQQDYKVELAAGWVTMDNDSLYDQPLDADGIAALVETAYKRSNFTSGVQISDADELILLSTCSYETDNARYVLLGRLVPLG